MHARRRCYFRSTHNANTSMNCCCNCCFLLSLLLRFGKHLALFVSKCLTAGWWLQVACCCCSLNGVDYRYRSAFNFRDSKDFATVNIFVLNDPQALLYRSNIIFSFISLVAGRKYCYRTLIERTLESKEEILSYIGNYVCCFHSLKSIFSPFL